MAERRMFAKTIVTSDAFLDMPFSTRCLYFALGVLADDDGFVNNVKSIMRQTGTAQSDLDLLEEKRFVIMFDSGVIAVKHWKIHNYVPKDRYKETKYIKEKSTLSIDEKGAYTTCIQDVYKMDTQDRLGKDRLGKDRVGEGSINTDAAAAKNQLQLLGGTLGKNVVFLSDRQFDDLLDRLGLDAFNRYVERLATFIIEKDAHVKNHYETILKWYEEDSKVGQHGNGE